MGNFGGNKINYTKVKIELRVLTLKNLNKKNKQTYGINIFSHF